jgi:galactokinase
VTLSSMIRKRDTGNLATAIPAIFATQLKREAATVARIATVAVANPKEEKPLSLLAEEKTRILAWLALIEETDLATIAEVIDQCQRDADARDYFTGRVTAELPKPDLSRKKANDGDH